MFITSFPYNLLDGNGFLYDILGDGQVSNGTIDAYDGAHEWQGFLNTSLAKAEWEGRNLVFEGQTATTGVVGERQVYVTPNGGTDNGFIRYLDTFTNTTDAAITYTYFFDTNLGSDSSTVILDTSSGDTTFDTADVSVISDDASAGSPGGDPVVGHVFGDGTLLPTTVPSSTGAIRFTYDVTLQPGESKSILNFGTQSDNLSNAIAKQNTILGLTTDVMFGLTQAEADRIINFDPTTFDLSQTEYNGTNDADTQTGTLLDETFDGSGGTDIITTGGGDDSALGGTGNDVISAESGDNFLHGQSGFDTVTSGDGDDTINGGDGNDVITVSGGLNIIQGNDRDDLITGGSDDDIIHGDTFTTGSAKAEFTVPSTMETVGISVEAVFDGELIEVLNTVDTEAALLSDYNLVYVVPTSTNTRIIESSSPGFGDVNGDGLVNSVLDGYLGAIRDYTDDLASFGVNGPNVSIVTYDSAAETVYTGRNAGGTLEALSSIQSSRTISEANYELALQETIEALLASNGDGPNRVVFMGISNEVGSSFSDEVDRLTRSELTGGLDAHINAISVTGRSDTAVLDLVDDSTANTSFAEANTQSVLADIVSEGALPDGFVDNQFIGFSNGTSSISGVSLESEALGFQFDGSRSIDNPTGDITATASLSDPDNTALSVLLPTLTKENDSGNDTIFGGGGGDVIKGGDGNDSLFGETGFDDIDGGADNDYLNGGSGDDTLYGGSGDDTILGGTGADDIDGGSGLNTAIFEGSFGGAGVDLTTGQGTKGEAIGDYYINIQNLIGTDGKDDFFGNGDANYFVGNRGSDLLRGAGGNDTIEGGIGGDDIRGGSGFDYAAFETAGAGVRVNLLVGEGTQGNANGDDYDSIEGLIGSKHDDELNGSNVANDIFGDSGTDTLRGYDGRDTLEGGSGADVIAGGSGLDTAAYRTAGSSVTVSLDTGLGTQGNANGDTLFSIENIDGSDHSDFITGNSGDNELKGFSGDDTIRGFGGDDTIEGGLGADDLRGGSGLDWAVYSNAVSAVSVALDSGTGSLGEAAGDTFSLIENLLGSNYGDVLRGSSLGNELVGGNGDDLLQGLGGNDTLAPGEGMDDVRGGSGTDLVTYESIDTSLFGSTGVGFSLLTEIGFSGAANGDTYSLIENATGTNLGDNITGSGGNNRLSGLDGDDVILGDGGNDTIFGGEGNDTLSGGSGDDVFNFNTALNATTNVDFITDFIGGSDKIQLSDNIFTAIGPTLDPGEFHFGSSAIAADDRIIYDIANRSLYYDPDGTGFQVQTLFATFDTAVTLSASDFEIV